MDEQVVAATPEQGPLAEDSFDANWEAAQRGTLPPPDASPPADEKADLPAPASAEAAPATPEWTPPSREQFEEIQKKARHFDSFQGNFPRIQERWEQEKVTPLQQQLAAEQAQRERLASERQEIINAYLSNLPADQREVQRQRLAQYDQTAAQEFTREQQRQQREYQIGIREQQVQQAAQEVQSQQEANLRQTIRQSVDPYAQEVATRYGIPVAEVAQYVNDLKIKEFIDQTDDLKVVGPMLLAVETYGQTRGASIAADNARRAKDNGTYRAEGTGSGAGGSVRQGVAQMPDKQFEDMWQAVMKDQYKG